MELTKGMKKALLQIGYGVTCRSDHKGGAGYYDENDQRIDIRSANSLASRGLIREYTSGGSPMRTNLTLSEKGFKLFEKYRKEKSQK